VRTRAVDIRKQINDKSPKESMAPFLTRVISLLLTVPSNDNTPKLSFSVCLSPGCVADGAQATLDKLQALAPPNVVTVEPGTCESLCGSGPIVSCQMRGKKILHRRIVGDSLLNLLQAATSSSSSSSRISNAIDDSALLLLWNGYNLVEQAQECFRNKQYEQAISLYTEGIQMALEPAQALVESPNNNEHQNGGMPRQFAWLVQAYCEESEAKLQVNDKEGALESARAACHLSKNTNAQSLTVLATACQAINDAHGELQALKAYFDLKEDDRNMPRNEANRRRSLGFRLQKLEREASDT
jgi:hypothetical protein